MTDPSARYEAADRVQQRRLARAVGADEADDLARDRAEVDLVDRDEPAEVNGELARREHGAVGVADASGSGSRRAAE